MYLCAINPPNQVAVQVFDDGSAQPFCELTVDCLEYTNDANEPTESVLVRVLENLEKSIFNKVKERDPSADEYALYENVVEQLKAVYPCIQSIIRKLKRRTVTQRELNLKTIKKELNLK